MPERCESVEPRLSAWLDGALEPGERALVAEHLAVCAGCRAERDGLARARAALRSLPVRHAARRTGASAVAARALGGDARCGAGSPPRRPPGAAPRTRVVTGVATGVTLLLGFAFALGGEAPAGRGDPPELVSVPLDALTRAHLARSGGPVGAPALVVFEDGPALLATSAPFHVRTGMVTMRGMRRGLALVLAGVDARDRPGTRDGGAARRRAGPAQRPAVLADRCGGERPADGLPRRGAAGELGRRRALRRADRGRQRRRVRGPAGRRGRRRRHAQVRAGLRRARGRR